MTALAGVSRATYYRFDPETAPAVRDVELRDSIQRIALKNPAYGRPRITAELKRQGWEVNHKRVGRILREDNLLCLRKRKFQTTTDSRHAYPVHANLLRNLAIDRPNQVWVADITSAIPSNGGIEKSPQRQTQKLTENTQFLSFGQSSSAVELCSCWNFFNLSSGHPHPKFTELVQTRLKRKGRCPAVSARPDSRRQQPSSESEMRVKHSPEPPQDGKSTPSRISALTRDPSCQTNRHQFAARVVVIKLGFLLLGQRIPASDARTSPIHAQRRQRVRQI
jgi:hypothetical protein